MTENNDFGTREFFRLCVQLGREPYMGGNVSSGTLYLVLSFNGPALTRARNPLHNLVLAHDMLASTGPRSGERGIGRALLADEMGLGSFNGAALG